MSKMHFIALARRIAEISNEAERKAAALAVADVAISFNGRFDRSRFLTACGVEL